MPLPLSLLAARLCRLAPQHPAGLLAVVRSERRAEALGRVLPAFGAPADVIALPPWDCLPFDRSSPSREAMGARMGALRRIAEARAAGRAHVVVATPDALYQRLPPASALAAARSLAVGDEVDPDALAAALVRAGYVADVRIDEAGEIARRGQVFEIFAAGTGEACRLDLAGGRIEAIRLFDPASQRTVGETDRLILDPASEIVDLGPEERTPGIEHWLPAHVPGLVTLFDHAAGAAVALDEGASERAAAMAATVAEGHRDALRWRAGDAARPPADPDHLYLTRAEWAAATAGAIDLSSGADAGVPDLSTGARPWRAFAALLADRAGAGRRVVLAAASEEDLARLAAAAARALPAAPSRLAALADADALAPGSAGTLLAPVDDGFDDPDAGLVLVPAAAVLGSRAHEAEAAAGPSALTLEETFSLGDVVIHVEHGLGVLQGIETVETEATGRREVLRLGYARGETLLVPVEEIDKVWRYGSDPEAVTLDRLDGKAWEKRRAKVEAAVAETARAMVDLAAARRNARAPKLSPPPGPYETFVSRFPFHPTPDQARAVEAVLADMASGRPMDRLVVGDVGYGKTEVALRAAAVAALSGRQVAVAAPTTVLARQHVETFTRRFADLGVAVGHLSRLVPPAEARRVREGLKSGAIGVVVGTHALVGRGVAFADLALVVIDEEQRFGAAHKRRLRALADGAHVLTLTATPIPRTLQSALVGLQEVSLIRTAPARRRPIRTFTIRPDVGTVRQALARERRRGGQSFFVVPRIEMIEGVVAALKEAVPDLSLLVAHGGLPAAEVDEAMVAFAGGRGDVLVSTNIIETGLDVPRANTMVVWHADLFGLAQLHQLRGRVGRGRAQGVCYLVSEADEAENGAAARRLGTLAALDRLGAGMEISARDLDARGAGDLVGDEQAGHLKLIGAGLYQRLLERALEAARGRPADDADPVIRLDLPVSLPAGYIPEPDLRITVLSRIARARDEAEVDRLADELEDRFGPAPPEAEALFAEARLAVACRRLGVARVDAGPQAVAFTLRPGAPALAAAAALAASGEAEIKDDRLIWRRSSGDAAGRLAAAGALAARLS